MAEKSSSLSPVSNNAQGTRLPRLPPILTLTALLLSFGWILNTCSHTMFSVQDPNVRVIPSESTTRNPAYLIRAKHGAAATENLRCSEMGVDVLKIGGNAVDAAISSTLCIGVVNMFSSGIGGGGFMVVRIPPPIQGAESQVFALDFRETSPALSNRTMYVNQPEAAKWGGLSVGVPGEVMGLYEAHSRWGKLPWSRLVMPSVALARGWKVDRELAKRLPWFSELILENPDWSSVFAPQGRILAEGETVRRTNLSHTLHAIARQGPDAFYKGPIARSMVKKVQETGGILTEQDLLNYQVTVSAALKGTYHGRPVYTTLAPSSGPALLHMFNLLEEYQLDGSRDALNVHRLVEVLKFGFAARTKICDPSSTDDIERIRNITTKLFASEISKNMTDDRTHPPSFYNPVYDIKPDNGTSHISIVDKNGMVAAVTSTINQVFGSQVMDPETGIILNDEQDDFSTPGFANGFGLWPSPYNYPEPGKRPLSSMAPVILEHEDGSFYASAGGSGGSRIFGAVLQTLLNVIEWKMDASAAVEYGRVHDQLYPMFTEVDEVLPEDVIEGLVERGHNVTVADINRVAAVVQLVMQGKDGVIYAASDSRKNGIAAGY